MLHDISRLAYRLPFENGMKGGMKSLRREGSPDDGFFGGHSMFGEYTYNSSGQINEKIVNYEFKYSCN
jgi:hypothetical protein